MRRRLAGWINAPIAERQRRRLFAAAAGMLVLTAALLLVTRPAHGGGRSPATRSTVAVRAVSNKSAATPTRAKRQAGAHDPAGEVDVVARRFLVGYLAYLYGQGSVRAITDTTRSLRHRLIAQRLVVPPAERQRRPRIVSLTGSRAEDGQSVVRVRIADGGVADYPITLTVALVGGRWLVSGVGE